MKTEQDLFEDFRIKNRLKRSEPRNRVIEKFLSTEKHISALELYNEMRRQGIVIGFSTVYRTLSLLAKSGVARKVDLGKGEARFEHQFGHRHHDHLFCLSCGKMIEFTSPKIERLQRQIAQKNNFKPQAHNLVIYGLCQRCR
jgi:Fur family ferric uptake transcriptional regulator|uniref:Ferric uptake regulation protein n=1 Tax=candidate division WOR-3 bacterium TaxID=2052148 RepID=A0A7C6EBQ9_UNCW3